MSADNDFVLYYGLFALYTGWLETGTWICGSKLAVVSSAFVYMFMAIGTGVKKGSKMETTNNNSTINTLETPKFEEKSITMRPNADKPWMIRLSEKNGIQLNREDYPHAIPDDFAAAFVETLENVFNVSFEKNGA